MTKRVLLTGASGLIGYALGCRLVEQGYEVIGTDQTPPREPVPFTFEPAELTEIHRFYAMLHRHPVDAVLHCGAVSGPMVARDNPHLIVQSNVVGTANLLEATRVLGIPRLVYCSSCMTYGDTPPAPVAEDAPQRPATVYAGAKAAGEQLVHAYIHQHKLDAVSLRISWVYGPRRQTDCTIRDMLLAGLNRQPFRLPWGRDYHRQYVYVDDVVTALIRALQAEAFPQPAYNITGGSYATVEEIAALVRARYPGVDIQLGDGADPQDSRQQRFDISAAARDLGYVPQVSLERGIELYGQWLEAQPGR